MRGSWISYFAWRHLRMALQLNVFQKVVYKESKMVTQILQWRIYYHRLEAHSTLHTWYFNHRTQIKCSRDFLKVFYVGEFILYSHDLNTKHVRFSNVWSLFRLPTVWISDDITKQFCSVFKCKDYLRLFV